MRQDKDRCATFALDHNAAVPHPRRAAEISASSRLRALKLRETSGTGLPTRAAPGESTLLAVSRCPAVPLELGPKPLRMKHVMSHALRRTTQPQLAHTSHHACACCRKRTHTHIRTPKCLLASHVRTSRFLTTPRRHIAWGGADLLLQLVVLHAHDLEFQPSCPTCAPNSPKPTSRSASPMSRSL